MNKKYQAILKDIDTTNSLLEQKKQAITEAEQRMNEAKEGIKVLQAGLKDAIVTENSERVELLEHQIAETEKLASRSKVFAEGTKELLPAIETRLAGLSEERDNLFSNLAGAWLTKERASYDLIAKELLNRATRILTVRNLLDEGANLQIYYDALGDAHEVFPNVAKVPIFEGFTKSAYISGRRLNPYTFKDSVLEEIIKISY